MSQCVRKRGTLRCSLSYGNKTNDHPWKRVSKNSELYLLIDIYTVVVRCDWRYQRTRRTFGCLAVRRQEVYNTYPILHNGIFGVLRNLEVVSDSCGTKTSLAGPRLLVIFVLKETVKLIDKSITLWCPDLKMKFHTKRRKQTQENPICWIVLNFNIMQTPHSLREYN